MPVIVVAITMYTATIGVDPLYCGRYYGDVGVAWDFAENGGRCGDTIEIRTLDGEIYRFPALDSGAFGRHCVRQLDGSCPRIAVDVPHHLAWFDGLSTLAHVENISERARLEEYPQ